MKYRYLAKTGVKVSEVSFGTIPILSGNVPVLPDYYNPDEINIPKTVHMIRELVSIYIRNSHI